MTLPRLYVESYCCLYHVWMPESICLAQNIQASQAEDPHIAIIHTSTTNPLAVIDRLGIKVFFIPVEIQLTVRPSGCQSPSAS